MADHSNPISWAAAGLRSQTLKGGGIEIQVTSGVSYIGTRLTAEQAEDFRTWLETRQEAPARHTLPRFSKIYPIEKAFPDTGYRIVETEESAWYWEFLEPGEEPESSEENYPTRAEALRSAARNWDESGGVASKIASTLRGLAAREES